MPKCDLLMDNLTFHVALLTMQSTLLVSSQHPPTQLHDFLPKPRDQTLPASTADGSSKDEEEKNAAEPQLRIAWQYGKYLRKNQEASTPSTRSDGSRRGKWCHDFDLSKGWGDSALAKEHQSISLNGGEARLDLVDACMKFVESLDFREKGGRVGRMAVLSFGSIDWELGYGCPQTGSIITKTLLQLKAAIFQKRCVVMVTLPANTLTLSDANRVRHIADICFTLDSHHEPSVSDVIPLVTDAGSVTGIIRLDKFRMAPGLMPSQFGCRSQWNLVRQRRKKMDITPMEIDPDAEAAVGSEEVQKSGPACGANVGSAPSLDF